MTTRKLTSAVVATIFTANLGTAIAGTPCEEQLATASQTNLDLPFTEFDQTPARGWRALSEQGCFTEAVELIRRYRNANPKSHPVLVWHQAQMEASAGSTANAISLAKATLRPDEVESNSDFRWNFYALGVIAFLEGSREELERNANKLAENTAKEPLNSPNLASLRRLLSCFGQPYSVASTCHR
jgi:hypothetical protein